MELGRQGQTRREKVGLDGNACPEKRTEIKSWRAGGCTRLQIPDGPIPGLQTQKQLRSRGCQGYLAKIPTGGIECDYSLASKVTGKRCKAKEHEKHKVEDTRQR